MQLPFEQPVTTPIPPEAYRLADDAAVKPPVRYEWYTDSDYLIHVPFVGPYSYRIKYINVAGKPTTYSASKNAIMDNTKKINYSWKNSNPTQQMIWEITYSTGKFEVKVVGLNSIIDYGDPGEGVWYPNKNFDLGGDRIIVDPRKHIDNTLGKLMIDSPIQYVPGCLGAVGSPPTSSSSGCTINLPANYSGTNKNPTKGKFSFGMKKIIGIRFKCLNVKWENHGWVTLKSFDGGSTPGTRMWISVDPKSTYNSVQSDLKSSASSPRIFVTGPGGPDTFDGKSLFRLQPYKTYYLFIEETLPERQNNTQRLQLETRSLPWFWNLHLPPAATRPEEIIDCSTFIANNARKHTTQNILVDGWPQSAFSRSANMPTIDSIILRIPATFTGRKYITVSTVKKTGYYGPATIKLSHCPGDYVIDPGKNPGWYGVGTEVATLRILINCDDLKTTSNESRYAFIKSGQTYWINLATPAANTAINYDPLIPLNGWLLEIKSGTPAI